MQQASLHEILLGGDQLTVARARNTIRQHLNSPLPAKCIAGLIPAVEDWRKILMMKNIDKLEFGKF